MSLSDYITSLNIRQELIPLKKKNRPGEYIDPTFVTIHNTGNDDRGADAYRNSRFVREIGGYDWKGKWIWVSWHYTVDDKVCIQQLPEEEMAYHSKGGANSSSIAIEICMHHEINQQHADDRAARLCAYLLYAHSISIENLKRHKDWQDKECPELLLPKWQEFKVLVKSYLDQLNGTGVVAFNGSPDFRYKGCGDGESEN